MADLIFNIENENSFGKTLQDFSKTLTYWIKDSKNDTLLNKFQSQIVFIILIYKIRICRNEIKKIKKKYIEQTLLTSDFETALNQQKILSQSLENISQTINIINIAQSGILLSIGTKYLHEIKQEIKELIEVNNSLYDIKLKDVFSQKEDASEYVTKLSSLADIWDYEETELEKEQNKKDLFYLKKQITLNGSV